MADTCINLERGGGRNPSSGLLVQTYFSLTLGH